MKLRWQLVIIALVTLTLPWAGCQYVKEMEKVLRKGQESTVLASARIIGESVGREEAFYPEPRYVQQGGEADIYAYPLTSPIAVDGYDDDWSGSIGARAYSYTGERSSSFSAILKLAIDRGSNENRNGLYVHLAVKVPDISYQNPIHASIFTSDSVILQLQNPDGELQQILFATGAPGTITAKGLRFDKSRVYLTRLNSIRGKWQDTVEGYNLELRLPLSMAGSRFAFSVVHPQGKNLQLIGSAYTGERSRLQLRNFMRQQQLARGYLIEPSAALQKRLGQLEVPDSRFVLVDSHRWVLARQGQFSDLVVPSYKSAEGIMAIIYRWILDDTNRLQLIDSDPGRIAEREVLQALTGEVAVGWYRFADNRAVVMAAYPVRSKEEIFGPAIVAEATTSDEFLAGKDKALISDKLEGKVIGAVLVQKGTGDILLLANEAWGGLVKISLLVMMVVLGMLMGFAALLSWRIRSLSQQAEQVISLDGQLAERFEESSAKDEIGDLSRSFSRLHHRAQNYTQYLQGLSSKLAHELRTPLAVIRTSLENQQTENVSPAAENYRNRALAGADRLRSIIEAMSEARRVEQSIASAEKVEFELDQVVNGMVRAYQDVYSDHDFRLDQQGDQFTMIGDPDLIVQLLDKLVDNATGFAPAGTEIIIGLERKEKECLLSVTNTGSSLPENMRAQLFDSMVSMRPSTSDRHHLGFGLYIVRLITEHYRGRVEAFNLDDGEGVTFRVTLATD